MPKGYKRNARQKTKKRRINERSQSRRRSTGERQLPRFVRPLWKNLTPPAPDEIDSPAAADAEPATDAAVVRLDPAAFDDPPAAG